MVTCQTQSQLKSNTARKNSSIRNIFAPHQPDLAGTWPTSLATFRNGSRRLGLGRNLLPESSPERTESWTSRGSPSDRCSARRKTRERRVGKRRKRRNRRISSVCG